MFGDIGSIGSNGLGCTNDTAEEFDGNVKMLIIDYCEAWSLFEITLFHLQQIGSSPPQKTPDLDNTRNGYRNADAR